MRKLSLIILIGISLFLASCDPVIEDVLEELPVLELIGESEVSLNIGDIYTDSGVKVINDQNYEVMTESTVDTTKIGTYTVTYSILYKEITIYAYRTVIVTEEESIDFEIDFSLIKNEGYSLTYEISLSDENNALENTYAVLYLGTQEVSRQEYTKGLNTIVFSNLLSNTDYRLVLEGDFYFNDLIEYISGYEETVKTIEVFDITPAILLYGDGVITLNEGDDFVDPGAYVEGIENAEIIVNTNLNTNAAGNYYIEYIYYYGSKSVTMFRSVIVEGVVKVKPEVTNFTYTTTSTEIRIEFDVVDETNSFVSAIIELRKGLFPFDSIEVVKGHNIIVFNTDIDAGRNHYAEITVTYNLGLNNISESIGGDNQIFVPNEMILNGDEEITLYYSDDFTDPGITVTGVDNPDISIISELDTSIIGTYQIVYIYRAYFDAPAIVRTRTVHVIEKPAPQVENITYEVTPNTFTIEFDVIDDTGAIILGEAGYGVQLIPFTSTKDIIVGHNVIEFTYPFEEGRTYLAQIMITFDTDGEEATEEFSGGIYFDILPEIELIGEEEVTLTFLNQYQDPGATLIGMSDDYITIESDLNIAVIGTYTIVYSYVGLTEVVSITRTIHVVEKIMPIISGYTINTTASSIEITLDISDEDSAVAQLIGYFSSMSSSTCAGGSIADVVLAHDNTLTLTYDNDVFPGCTYRPLLGGIIVKYDIGYGMEEIKVEVPSIRVLEDVQVISSSEKEEVFAGEPIILKVELDNLGDEDITYIIINDVIYEDFDFPTDYDTLYVNLGNEDIGEYQYTITEIGQNYGTDDQYSYSVDNTTTISVLEVGSVDPSNATVEVLDITSTIDGGNVFTALDDSVTKTVYIHLNNQDSLLVTGIELYNEENNLTTDFNIISPSLLSMEVNIIEGENNLHIQSISYTLNEENRVDTIEYTNFGIVYGYYESTITNIYTVDDFLNMTTFGQYRLMNDIDFNNLELLPLGTEKSPFTGFFNGNGYTISNIEIDTPDAVEGDYEYIGIFGKSTGFIAHLSIENIGFEYYVGPSEDLLEIDISGYVGLLVGQQSEQSIIDVHILDGSINISIPLGSFEGSIGGLAGELIGSNHSIIKDSSSDVDITINLPNVTANTKSYYVGGLVGSGSNYDILHCNSVLELTYNTPNYINSTGGLVGYLEGLTSDYDNGVYIKNSYSSIIIDESYANSKIGGLLGSVSDDELYRTIIDTSFSYGTITTLSRSLGGLVGDNLTEIRNSFSTVTLLSNYDIKGAIYANEDLSNTSNTLIDNVYSWNRQGATGGFESLTDSNIEEIRRVSTLQFDTPNFYIEFLGFDDYFFDFSELDVYANQLPTHS